MHIVLQLAFFHLKIPHSSDIRERATPAHVGSPLFVTKPCRRRHKHGAGRETCRVCPFPYQEAQRNQVGGVGNEISRFLLRCFLSPQRDHTARPPPIRSFVAAPTSGPLTTSPNNAGGFPPRDFPGEFVSGFTNLACEVCFVS